MTIRTVRLPLALIVEILWSFAAIALFVRIIGGEDAVAPSIYTVAAVVVGSSLLAKALQQTELDDQSLRIAGAAMSLIALLLILQCSYAPRSPWDLRWVANLILEPHALIKGNADVIAAAIAVSVCWMRGVLRGQRELDFDDVLSSSAIGLAPVALAAAAAPAVHGPDVFGVAAIAYVLAILCALAVHHAPDPNRSLMAFASQWSVALAALVGVAFALTIAAAAIDPDAFGVLAPIGRPLEYVASLLVTFVLGPPIAALYWLLQHILPGTAHDVKPQIAQPPQTKPNDNNADRPLWLQIVGWIAAGGAAFIVVAVLALILWSLFRRFARPKQRPDERRERVEARVSLADDLGALFDGLLGRFRRTPGPSRSAIEIRRLYAEMLDHAAASGALRPPSSTPRQFAPALDRLYTSDTPSAITEAFVTSRYALRDPSPESVATLRTRWRSLRTT